MFMKNIYEGWFGLENPLKMLIGKLKNQLF